MIDSHCHLERFDYPQEIIAEARQKMDAIVTSCAAAEHKDITLRFSQQHSGFVFSTLGLHPSEVIKMTPKQIHDYMDFIRQHSSEIVGIGEVGLDYFWIKDKTEQEESKFTFRMFIDLANELKLPLVIHTRDAMAETLRMLEQAKVPVMIHHFSGNLDDLEICKEREYYVSISTIICRSEKLQRIVSQVPMDRMVLETDAPWNDPLQTEPSGESGKESGRERLTNKPWNISYSADIIAKQLGLLAGIIEQTTKRNAIRLFKLQLEEE